MKLDLIAFASPLHDRESIWKARRSFVEGLRAFSDLRIFSDSEYAARTAGREAPAKETESGSAAVFFPTEDSGASRENPVPDREALQAVFIASGGTEEMFLQRLPMLEQPLVILSDGYHNSLAASFEICSWLEANGYEHHFLHLPEEADSARRQAFRDRLTGIHDRVLLRRRMAGMRLGLIGGSSGWLIASQIDRTAVSRETGLEFVDLPMSVLTERFEALKRSGRDFENDPLTVQLAPHLVPERSRTDLAEAVALYHALREICAENRLDAVTVKCFDLLAPCRTTTCLAMALLNDEGTVAGCEGDIPSVYTMLTLKILSGRPGFMANPSSADRSRLTVDFAHCTLPLSFGSEFRLPSHFESGMGIGIQARVPEGPCTILKIGGQNLDRKFACTGRLVACPQVPQRCRTQVRFRFDSLADFDRFMANRLGNHVILARGEVNLP